MQETFKRHSISDSSTEDQAPIEKKDRATGQSQWDRTKHIHTSMFYDPDTRTGSPIDLSIVQDIVGYFNLGRDQQEELQAKLLELKPRSPGINPKGIFPDGDKVLDHIATLERFAAGISKLRRNKEEHFYSVEALLDIQESHSSHTQSEFDLWDWLSKAESVAALCNRARTKSDEITSFQSQMSEGLLGQEDLLGRELPRLFEAVTGKRFGISKTDNKPNATGGVLFVMECVCALGLPSVTPNNVERHWKAAKDKDLSALGTPADDDA